MKGWVKALCCCAVSIGTAVVVNAQQKEDDVKAVITKMFAAMRTADSLGVVQCFATGAHMETIATTKDKSDTIRSNAVSQFAGSIMKQPAGALDERITFGTISIDGKLAHVWTPYQFYFNGSFSHCGVNSFTLVQINGTWKIQHIIDTRRKDNCL
jgi:hypothetical protein